MHILSNKKFSIVLSLILAVLVLAAGCGGKNDPAGQGAAYDQPLTAALEQSEAADTASAADSSGTDRTGGSDENSDESAAAEVPDQTNAQVPDLPIDEDGIYTSKDDVALYIHTYGKLPSNFITKSEARKLGWEGGPLEEYAPGMCIGGDYFGNYEELLPKGRSYKECDIDTLGKKSRGAKRIIYSDDGLIYYTEDHYESYILLYGDE